MFVKGSYRPTGSEPQHIVSCHDRPREFLNIPDSVVIGNMGKIPNFGWNIWKGLQEVVIRQCIQRWSSYNLAIVKAFY